TRQRRERTRGRYSAQTRTFNPKFNDFGFDPDQVSKLENANLKTWPVSRRCHFRPPDPRLNYEPDWTRRMSALGQKRTFGEVKLMSALLPKADVAQRARRETSKKKEAAGTTPLSGSSSSQLGCRGPSFPKR